MFKHEQSNYDEVTVISDLLNCMQCSGRVTSGMHM